MSLRYKHNAAERRRADAGAIVIEWVRDLIGDKENTSVSVTANTCGHSACGGDESVILLMRPGGRTTGLKIAKSLDRITQADVAELLRPFLSP